MPIGMRMGRGRDGDVHRDSFRKGRDAYRDANRKGEGGCL